VRSTRWKAAAPRASRSATQSACTAPRCVDCWRLFEEGFVRRSASDDSFRLTLDVPSLSEGFTDDERIATIAPQIMARMFQRVAWPSDLTTPDGDAMVIRETAHGFSQLSFHRSMVGRGTVKLMGRRR